MSNTTKLSVIASTLVVLLSLVGCGVPSTKVETIKIEGGSRSIHIHKDSSGRYLWSTNLSDQFDYKSEAIKCTDGYILKEETSNKWYTLDKKGTITQLK